MPPLRTRLRPTLEPQVSRSHPHVRGMLFAWVGVRVREAVVTGACQSKEHVLSSRHAHVNELERRFDVCLSKGILFQQRIRHYEFTEYIYSTSHTNRYQLLFKQNLAFKFKSNFHVCCLCTLLLFRRARSLALPPKIWFSFGFVFFSARDLHKWKSWLSWR